MTVADVWNLYQVSKTIEGMSQEEYNRTRYLPWNTCVQTYENTMANRINKNLIYVMTHYCGDTPTWDYAAAGGGPWCFISSFACCHDLAQPWTDPLQNTLAYAIGHEIGHCFGLSHTDAQLAPDDWEKSIMQAARPPEAILVNDEKQKLLNNPFLV